MALQFDGAVLSVAFAEPPSPQEVDDLAGRIGYRIHAVLADPVLIAEHVGGPRDGSAPDGGRASGGNLEELLQTGIGSRTDDTVPLPHRRPTPVRGVGRCLGPPSDGGHAGDHPPARCHAPHRGVPAARQRHHPGHDLRDPAASQRERFEAEHELDTSHTIPGVGRFRVNVALQRGTVTASLRPIPHEMPVFASLGLPDSIRSFTDLRRGLVLVTGPTGSGKSTTLASLVDNHQPDEAAPHRDRGGTPSNSSTTTRSRSSPSARSARTRTPSRKLSVGYCARIPTSFGGRASATPRDHLDGADSRRNRSPRLRYFAHPGCPADDRPRRSSASSMCSRRSSRSRSGLMLASTLEGVVTQQLVPTADGRRSRALCRGSGVHFGGAESDPDGQDPPDLFTDAGGRVLRNADHGPGSRQSGQGRNHLRAHRLRPVPPTRRTFGTTSTSDVQRPQHRPTKRGNRGTDIRTTRSGTRAARSSRVSSTGTAWRWSCDVCERWGTCPSP